MSDQDDNPSLGSLRAGGPDEAQALIDLLLDRRLPEEGRRQLERMIGADPAVARLYVLSVHLLCCLPVHVSQPEQIGLCDDEAAGFDDDLAAARPLDEAMILPALRDDGPRLTPVEAALAARPAVPTPPAGARTGSDALRSVAGRRWFMAWGTIAALLLVAVYLTWSGWASGPPAVVTATAGATVADAAGVSPGRRLDSNAAVQLTAGAVELTFASGATVVVQAPARFHVIDRNSLALEDGALAAHVPPSALGFRVEAPGLTVVDRGTNFGVRTAAGDTAAEVHVFAGVVEVTGDDGDHRLVSAPVRVTAGQAVAHAQAACDAPPVAIAFAAKPFIRDLHDVRMVVPTHGTGVGLAGGAADPYWQIVSVPGDPAWQPRAAAVVIDPRPEYLRNGPVASWVSTTAHMADSPAGQYIYRTTIDLTGFDPTSASAVATSAADDGIIDIRVNGVSVRAPAQTEWMVPMMVPHQWALARVHWHGSANLVEVVVLNNPRNGQSSNYTGLQLSWDVSAAPLVRTD